MKKQQILHISIADKFINPFILFIEDHFDISTHHFFILGGDHTKFIALKKSNVYQCHGLLNLVKLIGKMQISDKIFIHGLSFELTKILVPQTWLLDKCYWMILGGDLYFNHPPKKGLKSNIKNIMSKFVISRIKHFITHIEGDYKLAQKWYGANGQWHECFMYPSNLSHEIPKRSLVCEDVNILLGNSADPSNNHAEAMDKLRNHTKENTNINIYCPLSYGDQLYARKISAYGRSLFGNKFIALHNFLPLQEYTELLRKIDIAIFNHPRQQGMGNIVGLLGSGKKVYLRNDVTTWQTLKNLGIEIYDIKNLDLLPIHNHIAQNNKQLIANYFSRENLIYQWSKIFGEN